MMYFRWLDLTPDPGWGFLTPVPSLSTITTTLKLLILSYRYQFNKGPIIELIKILHLKFIWYRGYYTLARRYEFYVRVARTISQEWAKNVLFIIWRLPIQQKQKAGIVTSLNDTTLTKVTDVKIRHSGPGWNGVWNESTSGLVPSKTLSSI